MKRKLLSFFLAAAMLVSSLVVGGVNASGNEVGCAETTDVQLYSGLYDRYEGVKVTAVFEFVELNFSAGDSFTLTLPTQLYDWMPITWLSANIGSVVLKNTTTQTIDFGISSVSATETTNARIPGGKRTSISVTGVITNSDNMDWVEYWDYSSASAKIQINSYCDADGNQINTENDSAYAVTATLSFDGFYGNSVVTQRAVTKTNQKDMLNREDKLAIKDAEKVELVVKTSQPGAMVRAECSDFNYNKETSTTTDTAVLDITEVTEIVYDIDYDKFFYELTITIYDQTLANTYIENISLKITSKHTRAELYDDFYSFFSGVKVKATFEFAEMNFVTGYTITLTLPTELEQDGWSIPITWLSAKLNGVTLKTDTTQIISFGITSVNATDTGNARLAGGKRTSFTLTGVITDLGDTRGAEDWDYHNTEAMISINNQVTIGHSDLDPTVSARFSYDGYYDQTIVMTENAATKTIKGNVLNIMQQSAIKNAEKVELIVKATRPDTLVTAKIQDFHYNHIVIASTDTAVFDVTEVVYHRDYDEIFEEVEVAISALTSPDPYIDNISLRITNSHTYTSVITPPTTTSSGYTTHTCTACGAFYRDSEVPALTGNNVIYIDEAGDYDLSNGAYNSDYVIRANNVRIYSLSLSGNLYINADNVSIYDGSINGSITSSGTNFLLTRASVNGDVSIGATNTTLTDCTINGNVTIEKTVGNGVVTIERTNITKTVTIKGGGSNSIKFIDSGVSSIVVDKEMVGGAEAVRILTQGTTTVQNVEVLSDVILANEGASGAVAVIVLPAGVSGLSVEIRGDYPSIQVDSPGITLNVSSGAVGSLLLSETASGVNLSGGGSISNLLVNENVADSVNVSNDALVENTTTTYTVRFEANGGSEIVPVQVAGGEKLATPAAPTRSGYSFSGWYSDAALTTAWDFGADTVNAALTLYAKWTVNYTYRPNPATTTDPEQEEASPEDEPGEEAEAENEEADTSDNASDAREDIIDDSSTGGDTSDSSTGASESGEDTGDESGAGAHANSDDDDRNPSTGIVLALMPIGISAFVVLTVRKKK